MAPRRIAGWLYGTGATLIWGGFPIVTRLGVTGSRFDMYDVTFLRFSIATLVTFPILMRARLPNWRVVLFLTIGMGAPYILVVTAGLTYAPVALFAVLTPTGMALFSFGLSIWFLDERPSRWQFAGILAVALGGTIATVTLVCAYHSSLLAVGFFLAGGLLWAIYTVTTKSSGIDARVATAIVPAVSILIYAPPYLLMRGADIFHHPWHDLAVQGLYQGVLVSVVALFFYNQAVKLLSISAGACFAAFVPTVVMIDGIIFLNEFPTLTAACGLGLSTFGIFIALLAPSRPPQIERKL